ncbi:hypothetical protein L1887_15449 [Cichorium endivia]|nr:hypothetical protein L1887_15449 [Cichorium endivia]
MVPATSRAIRDENLIPIQSDLESAMIVEPYISFDSRAIRIIPGTSDDRRAIWRWFNRPFRLQRRRRTEIGIILGIDGRTVN